MKSARKFLFLIITLAVSINVVAQEEAEVETGPHLVFEESEHDFGDIYQGDKLEHIFKFTNQGTEPLILSNVATTCGCTATFWPKDPIVPGESSEIKITFNSAGKMGRQNKIITIYSNSTQSMTRVKIITNVLPPKKEKTED
jgi:hypothetical protein